MNDFRKKLLGGQPLAEPLLKSKKPRGERRSEPGEESLPEDIIPREAPRIANHRTDDRHRLCSETARLVHGDTVRDVTLVNLSGGGAMIEGGPALKLWDRVELQFGDSSGVEAVVRWVRGNRLGLEFAHETRIDAEVELLEVVLRSVIHRSFPDVELAASVAPPVEPAIDEVEVPAEPEEEAVADRELRHPLIWSGIIHFDHQSTPVRLRNISSGGALVEGSKAFPVGASLLLDLDEAGTIFAIVQWVRGDLAGLQFEVPFDLANLAKAKPEVTGPRWVAPDYLRVDQSASSPWAKQWGRKDLAGLHRSLEQRKIFR